MKAVLQIRSVWLEMTLARNKIATSVFLLSLIIYLMITERYVALRPLYEIHMYRLIQSILTASL